MAINAYWRGTAIRLGNTVRNTAGDPTTTTLSLVVTKGDGTTAAPTVAQDSTGVYHADVTLDVAGRWYYDWVGTGAVVVAQQGELWVRERVA